MELHLPAGALGPGPVTLDVRAYLVSHATGVVLVDTGMDAGGPSLDAALIEVGASWSDVSHVLISHAHPACCCGGSASMARQHLCSAIPDTASACVSAGANRTI